MDDQTPNCPSAPRLKHPVQDGDQAVLQGLLTGLLGSWPEEITPSAQSLEPEICAAEPVEQKPEPVVEESRPTLDSTSTLTDFIEGLRSLLESSHVTRPPLQLPGALLPTKLVDAPATAETAQPEEVEELTQPDETEEPLASYEEFQAVADGLLAELLGHADSPTPAPAAAPADGDAAVHPGVGLSLLGLAASFAGSHSNFEDETEAFAEHNRPDGPFEALLDTIDSELGPRPQFHASHNSHEVARGERFVTFELADDWYALPLERVVETDRPTRHTFVPGMPAYFLGVLNLRGEILPLIDLRTLFGLEDATFEGRMLIIEDPSSRQRYAFRVDRLAGIVGIPQEEIGQPLPPDEDEEDELDAEDEEAPEPAVSSRIAPLLRGVAFPGTQSVHILDTDRLLAVATGCESLIS